MKKFISATLAALFMLAAFSVPVSAQTGMDEAPNACAHSWKYQRTVLRGPFGGDKEGCIMKAYDVYKCVGCGIIQERYKGIKHIDHIYEVIRSVHNGPRNQHTFDSRCTKCRYFTTGTVTCYGPPCPEPY